MTIVQSSLDAIYQPIEKDLAAFHECLREQLDSKDVLIRDIHEHLLKMSGKFLRPAVTLLVTRMCGRFDKRSVDLSAAIELIHTATLVHDDIIDNSHFRRNQPSVFSKWGQEISIVAGDYLYAKSFLLLASLKDVWVNEAMAICAHVMCEGEMKQIERRNNFLIGEDEYFKIIHKKTAALFQASAAGGAYFGGADMGGIEKMKDFGYQIGMAFQIMDDVLDVIGDTESMGKTAGLDIYKNDVTLPLLYLFGSLSESDRRQLESQISAEDPAVVARVKEMVLSSGAADRAITKARGFVDKAVADLSGFKENVYRDSLQKLANYCLERVR